MRSCTVRGLCENDEWEEFGRAEKHYCEDCRPDGWIILTVVGASLGHDDGDEMSANLRASAGRKLGEAMIQMADEIEGKR